MRLKLLIGLLVAILILLGATVAILLSGRIKNELPQSAQNAIISGTFDINGVIPDGGSITLLEKPTGTDASLQVFASNLPIADRSSWSFNSAKENTNYEIQAQVIVNGSAVATSSPIYVTAPADDETLILNIESKNQTGTAVISGNVSVNGYIPSGATLTLKGRKLGAQNFSTVASNVPAKARQFITYNTAVNGVTYEVQGELISPSGSVIGASTVLDVTAPATDEELIINSAATPPVTPVPTPAQGAQGATPTPAPSGSAVISGNINLNGAAPANSRIVVFQSPPNQSNYQLAVDNISPTDGASWSWNGAQTSTWYNLIAVLKQHNSNGTDTDIATSTPLSVAAPANNVVFTLNSNYSLSAPGGPITVNCQTYNGGPNQNTWNVTITVQAVSGAQSYWFQIGNNSGGNNITNTASQSNTVNAVFNNNTTYYAQYAYSNIPVAPLGSSQWSAFSSSTPLQCSH